MPISGGVAAANRRWHKCRHICVHLRAVQSYVIERFRETQDVCRFWIDKRSSPAEDSDEKQTTMISMDILYPRNEHSIGLLAVTPVTRDEVNYLQTFMIGDTVVRDWKDDYMMLARPA